MNEPQSKKSGIGLRLPILLVLGLIAVGGAWAYLQQLENSVPKGEAEFYKKPKEEENGEKKEDPSSLEILSEMIVGKEEGPSKEVEELKKAKEGDVVFTYAQIEAMSKADLEKNIADVQAQLLEKRSSLPPSFGAGSFGGGAQPAGEDGDAAEKEMSIQGLALPLEVMRQLLEKK